MPSSPAVAQAAPAHESVAVLETGLDFPMPRTLAVGRGTALFVCGWCFSPRARIRSLAFEVDGESQPVMHHGMPRADVFRKLHPGLDPFATAEMASDPGSSEDPSFRSFRSGFWGIACVPPGERDGGCELLLRAGLEDGGEAVAELARVPVAARAADPVEVAEPEPAAGPLVVICMATYDPAMELFRRQLDSIRAQTYRNWVCVISDDCSSPERFAAVRDAVDGDPRFVLSRSPRRLGFYHNFERALALAPPAAEYVGMADQDDFWCAEKLEALLAEIGDAQLVYSDARIVSGEGELISETYWADRRNNHSSLPSLLMANAVTGAASLFRREVLDYALPFPPGQFAHFHDHWVALTALALGDIAFVDRPLYDYVQHSGAVLGHAEANRVRALLERIRQLPTDPRERVKRWRVRFFHDNCRLLQYATVLRMRCGERMTPTKRRSVERFLRTDRSLLALGNLGYRAVRELIGPPQTLGAELALFLAFAWRRILTTTTRSLERPRRRIPMDALPPPNLARDTAHPVPAGPDVRDVAQKTAPLELAVRDDAPERVNLLIPTIDLEHFFGGYIGKLNLARRLAERGARVRVVTVDPVGPLPRSWARRLESYGGLEGLFERVEVVFGREAQAVEVSRSDRFVATTWWTAHIARSALESLGGGRFLYLIQEHEPFVFPMGTFSALASESYRFPHYALFSTELLRDYFRRHRIGVYAERVAEGDAASVAFENAITSFESPTAAELAGRSTRRLLFYARPEPHAARNMFELGLLALNQAVESGAFQRGWELHGIGTLDAGRRIELAAGLSIELLRRREQGAYADLLREHDVGLALMYTPHPSLVPIEMAAAGMLTVTNSFENKTAEAMTAISPNIITAEPGLDGLAAGLYEAAAGVEDYERRARGSEVRWSRDWDQSFGDELLRRVESFLNA
jgi:glycosyltransferase involved in cell wall biosynthesis